MRLASLLADKGQHRDAVEASPDPPRQWSLSVGRDGTGCRELESIREVSTSGGTPLLEAAFDLGGSSQAENGKDGVKQGGIPHSSGPCGRLLFG